DDGRDRQGGGNQGWRDEMSDTAWFIAIVSSLALLFIMVIGKLAFSAYSSPNYRVLDGGGPTVFTDPETGCEYFVRYGDEMEPRLDANGRPICVGGNPAPKGKGH